MKKEEVKKEKEKEKGEQKKKEALVTSRVLFISVLDKIYLIILALMLLFGTIRVFSGDIASLRYGYWSRIGREILLLITVLIAYLIFNWFYKCAVKTILCLTDKEVYEEHYIPFKRSEVTIPLNKITKVSTINLFWIFRSIVIHQYHQFPLVFMTWNNQEFKDKLEELLTNDKTKVENIYEDRNIITKEMTKYLKYIGLGLAAIILLIGFIRFFTYIFNTERKVAGTYTSGENRIVLKSDGSCDVEGIVDEARNCRWSYDNDDSLVNLDYQYSKYYSYYSYSDSITLKYNAKDKTLEYNNLKLSK